jgi:Protein of unknown function (DUF1360)
MVAVWTFLLVTLATARVTRLVVSDQIAAPLRRKVIAKSGTDGWFSYLIHCPFCVSPWLSTLAGAYWIAFNDLSWWLYPPAVFAMSYLVAPILFKFDQED